MRSLLLILIWFCLSSTYAEELMQQKLEQDLALISQLRQAQLPRLANKLWQRVDKQKINLSKDARFEHNIQGLQFLMAELRALGSGQGAREKWQRCQNIMKSMRSTRGISFAKKLSYLLMQFEIIEYAYQRDPNNVVMKELDHVVEQIDGIYEQQEEKIKLISQNTNRASYQEHMRQLYQLRYARAWLYYYQASLEEKAETARLYWQRARNEMEHFLSQPIDSVPFIRAVVAICRAELALDERQEALYLLDDIQADIHMMPFEHARMIWMEHLSLVETANEKDELYKSIDAYLGDGSDHNLAKNQLRFDMIEHMLGGERIRVNELIKSLAQKYINHLFTSGSHLADRCIPYVVRLSLVGGSADNDAIKSLAEAELLFKQRQCELAIPKYQSALQERSLRLNIRLYHMVTLNLAICQRRVQAYEDALRNCLGILQEQQVAHLHNLALQLFIMSAQEAVYQDIAIYQSVSQDFNKFLTPQMCKQHPDKVLRFGLSLYDVRLTDEAHAIFQLLKQHTDLAQEVAIVSSIMQVLHQDQPSLDDLIQCFSHVRDSFEFMSDRCLRFVALRLLATSEQHPDISQQKRSLVSLLRAQNKMTVEDVRRMDYLLAMQYLRSGKLQAHTDLLSRVLRTKPQDLWELQQLLQCADYICELTKTLKDEILINQVKGAYEIAVVFAEEQEQTNLALQYDFKLANLLMRMGMISDAQVILNGFPERMKNRWDVQQARIKCLELSGAYGAALKAWRQCAERLPAGGADFLTAKWHVAHCSLKTGDAEHARKISDYCLLMYPKMSKEMQGRFRQLAERAKMEKSSK